MALGYTSNDGQISHNGIEEEETRLNLAFEDLQQFPPSLINSFSCSVKILDLSYNSFSNLSFLTHFPSLTSLILDHNCVGSAAVFPTMPQLRLLWLNHNCISQLFPFVQRLKTAFPALDHLSLMANEAVPVNVDETTFYQHLQYRLFVISWFPGLLHLDDQTVTSGERVEAQRLYKRPLLERLAHIQPVTKVIRSVTAALGLGPVEKLRSALV